MADIIEQIKNKAVKEWFINDSYPLNSLSEELSLKGYNLDFDSGLFIKLPYKENTKKLGRTIIDVVFPRPVDLHYHKDVDEAFYIVEGRGTFYLGETGKTKDRKRPGHFSMQKNQNIYVPKNTLHAFEPRRHEYLEMRIACSGILNPKKEICVKRFDNRIYA